MACVLDVFFATNPTNRGARILSTISGWAMRFRCQSSRFVVFGASESTALKKNVSPVSSHRTCVGWYGGGDPLPASTVSFLESNHGYSISRMYFGSEISGFSLEILRFNSLDASISTAHNLSA